MELILKQDVENLGFKDDVVTVKLDKHAAAWAEKRRERVKSEKK